MRGRPDDPDLWGDLYERLRRPDDPPRRTRRGGRLADGLPPESSDRLIDAALGILGSIRAFVDVAEDLLEQRRSAPHGSPPSPEPWVRTSPTGQPLDEEGGVVRDIPLFGS